MNDLEKVSRLLRYYILTSTTNAGSGHVTSSLSSVELMSTLFFKYLHFDLDNPEFINNDRLIFSKGHASPLFYSLYKVAGKISEKDIMSLRHFNSVLEGHPSKRFRYTEVPTGSLGQGLSSGVGMALSAKLDKLDYITYVLLGDGEMAEGQIWEALEMASHYKLNNLVGIVDVNRLGQTGETLLGYDLVSLENRIKSFGWRTYIVRDGHSFDETDAAYKYAISELPKGDSPFMLIAKTIKGRGVSFLENKEGWHGRALDKKQLKLALEEIGEVDKDLKISKSKGANQKLPTRKSLTSDWAGKIRKSNFKLGEMVSTREAYGKALVELGKLYNDIVVLDGEVNNSTYSSLFKEKFPERFFEMYIAEQNMVSVALGLAERGKIPFVSTFSAFLERAYDQIRMVHLSGKHIIFCGSHAGVSIGEDGPSQMGLEDMSFFRSLPDTVILYPSDAVSMYKLIDFAYQQKGLVYIRSTRPKVPVIYDSDSDFEKSGSMIIKESDNDALTVVSAGITVYESLKAYEDLKKEGFYIKVIDAYRIKPIDKKIILEAAKKTKAIITVEDHYISGGLGDAVLEVLAKEKTPVYKLGVEKIPRSGKPNELLEYEGISAKAIVAKVKEILG